MGTEMSVQANDKASALFSMFCSLGAMVGPLIGGVLYDEAGINWACDTMAIISLSMAAIYFFLMVWPGSLNKTEKMFFGK